MPRAKSAFSLLRSVQLSSAQVYVGYPLVRPLHAQPTPDAGGRGLATLCPPDAGRDACRAAKIQTPEDEVSGTLQIAVPSDLGRNLLLPVFQSFRRRYPALRLRIFFSDQVTDVFKDPVDVAFRYGNTEDASYIALPVAPSNRRVLVASPEWVAQNGAPQTPDDLTQLNAMTFVLRGRLHDRWTFTRNGEVSSVQVNGTIMSDDAEVIRRLAIAGEGVAYKSWLDVSEDVRDGRLQLLMPDYQGEKVPLNMICPHRKQLSTAVRLLHDAVKARCEMLAQS